MTPLVAVAIGGAVAALLQFVFAAALHSRRRLSALNLSACAALGLTAAVDPPETLRWLLAVGLLASMAPFATIVAATLTSARQGHHRTAVTFFLVDVVGGIAAVMFGFLAWKSGVTLYGKII